MDILNVLAANEFGKVTKVALSKNINCLVIEHQTCQAKVSLYGGQVLGWQPKGQQPIFWLSKSSSYQKNKAIRGGVPLCWPWFGAHHKDPSNKAGNHGFARQRNWLIDGITIKPSGVEITLTLHGENEHGLWSSPFELTQTLCFGQHFKQTLTMLNLSEKPVEYTGALHSYFCVSSSSDIGISNLSSANFDDKLTGEYVEAEALLNGKGPVDRVYYTNEKIQIVDVKWQRIIEIESNNTHEWIFWNPGKELAQKMPDIHESGEQEFVCLEAANTKQQIIPAKSSVFIKQSVRILPLDAL